MPARQKYAPKHRSAPPARLPRKALRNTLVLSSVAVAATGVTVGGGVVSAPSPADLDVVAAGLPDVAPISKAQAAHRAEAPVSRSDRREPADQAKADALAASSSAGTAISRTENVADGDPRDVARALLPEYGFGPGQFGCLDSLYVSESNWRVHADNPSSSAYGIPQALTATHDLPDGYMTSAEVQIRWGLKYIQDRYGTPCNAWAFKQGHNWY